MSDVDRGGPLLPLSPSAGPKQIPVVRRFHDMPQPTMPVLDDVDGVTAIRVAATAEVFVQAAFESYDQELYGFLRRTTRDEALAEDLLQEAFLRLMREARAGRPPEQTRAWLYRVATNLAISRARRGRTVLAWLGRLASTQPREVTSESAEARVLRQEWLQALEAALARVGADARSALILSGQGFSGAEIAWTIGRSEAATRTLMSRARVKVRRIIETQEGV
jgi:RNA polymerase sigma-70 factor, ECF subfamily